MNTEDTQRNQQVILAPAKLTTSLRVIGVREDGMHEIDAEMVALDFYDELTITPGGSGVTIVGESVADIDPENNLITKAAQLAGMQVGVHLDKHIPAGAGLGGGSADAAAVLRWAGFTDVERAATIGADVAFCVMGGRARVRGIGEIVEPLPFRDQTFTIVTPQVHCSTLRCMRNGMRWDFPKGTTATTSNRQRSPLPPS